ncbi:hypothetical protein [Aestuariivirga sp.]|uniref:hypothetical protein n=1 Tax=Aestuariivirga sp. TaxID=2650926 RepID=UPI0039E72929
MTLIAYHNDPSIKDGILAQLRGHAAADQLVKDQYWQNGKGCAVGCTIHGRDHMEYEPRFGIPVMLARLEDTIFEGLPNAEAQEWPVRFMDAIRPGADLSRVGWQFLHWLLTDETVNPGINAPLVKDAVKQCADVLVPLTKGEPVDVSAAELARSAAWSARSAAWSAAWSARSAAWSARSAAWSAAELARSAAWSAGSAAWSARSAAWSAAESARSAAWSAGSAYVLMATKLISLIEAA